MQLQLLVAWLSSVWANHIAALKLIGSCINSWHPCNWKLWNLGNISHKNVNYTAAQIYACACITCMPSHGNSEPKNHTSWVLYWLEKNIVGANTWVNPPLDVLVGVNTWVNFTNSPLGFTQEGYPHNCLNTVDPRLSGYNGTRPWPDKWNSWICVSSCK